MVRLLSQTFLALVLAFVLAGISGGQVVLEWELPPVAGSVGEDAAVVLHVDTGSGGSAGDFAGGDRSLQGYQGTLFAMPCLSQSVIGAPVLAVADGAVVFVHDGEAGNDFPLYENLHSNSIVLRHGGGVTHYANLAPGSIRVQVGQAVRAGQQIARAGLTGFNPWPGVYAECRSGFDVFDPFDPAQSEARWSGRPDYNPAPAVAVAGYSSSDPVTTAPLLPLRQAFVPSDASTLWVWATVLYADATAPWRIDLIPPAAASIAFETGETTGAVIETILAEFASPALTPGTWTARLTYSGQSYDIPIVVIDAAGPSGVNQAPSAPELALEIIEAGSGFAGVCRIVSPPLEADLEQDPVTYRYRWTLSGEVLREEDSPARSDVLPLPLGASGELVCVAAPHDGNQWGTSNEETVTLPTGIGGGRWRLYE